MLPLEFETRMRKMLGGEYPAFLAEYENANHQSLRLNPLKAERGTQDALFLMQSKRKEAFSLTPVPWEPLGFYYGKEDRPGKDAYHDAGVYYIQEASAMLPARLLEPKQGEYVLDLCAAPGGKSTQLAGMLSDSGFLLSNEIHPARAKLLSENIERMGVANAVVTNEAPKELAARFAGFFDKILVDAPCSGEGMFRKNEEAIKEWSPENVQMCADRQREILSYAAQMLAPGGRLVYSTCTFSREENEDTIAWFLAHHPEFSRVEIPEEYYRMTNYPEGKEGMLRIYPHRVKGEGHFAAVLSMSGSRALKKTSVSCSAEHAKKDIDWPGTAEEEKEFLQFCRETLQVDLRERFPEREYLRFGEHLYLKPTAVSSLAGLKVLRAGLHIGTWKKGRFEPSHALALALSPKDVKRSVNFSAEDPTTEKYLNGQTFSFDGEKGWYAILVDGYTLGWGKLAGGVMKNHYPKGLRSKW